MSPRRCFIMLMTILDSASLKAGLLDILSVLLSVFVIGMTSVCVWIGWSTKTCDAKVLDRQHVEREEDGRSC